MTEGLEDMSRKYPEYDNYNEQQLNNEYDSLLNKHLDLLRGDTNPQDEQLLILKKDELHR